jgi:hypothetical protein
VILEPTVELAQFMYVEPMALGKLQFQLHIQNIL